MGVGSATDLTGLFLVPVHALFTPCSREGEMNDDVIGTHFAGQAIVPPACVICGASTTLRFGIALISTVYL